MDFKVKIKCCSCSCSFEFRGKHIETIDHLVCPNCKQQIPEDVFAHLQRGMVELTAVPATVRKYLNSEQSVSFGNLFEFSILSHEIIGENNLDRMQHYVDE